MGFMPHDPIQSWFAWAYGPWFGGRLVDEANNVTANDPGNVAAFDWIGQYKALAAENDKFTYAFLTKPDFYKLGYRDRVNIWLLLYAFWHQPFMSVSSDQLVIQRMLSTRGYKDALKAIYTNIALAVPVTLLIWSIGVGIPGRMPGHQRLR